MFSKKKFISFILCGMLSVSCMSMPVFAETQPETTESATETTAKKTEEITSGEYTYHIDEEYGGAVITQYKPKDKNVVLPAEIDGNTVVGLGDFIFDRQSNIETVTIPVSLCHIGASAFYGTGVKEFFVDAGHPMYKAEDGVLFSKDGIALVAYPPAKADTSYTVPDGVEELYHGCFASNTHLTELELPDSIIYIDSWAFAYTILEKLELPDNVKEIGAYSFAYMKRLTDIKLPPQIINIPSAAFAGSSNLVNVTLNEGLVEIGQGAFAGTAVRSIVIPTTVNEIGYCALGYAENLKTSYSTLVIYGLSGSVAQTYSNDKDEEYNYKNNFTFISKTSAQIKAMLSDGSEDETNGGTQEATEKKVIVKEEKTSNSAFTWKVIIMALGAVVLCGGIGAVAVSANKNKAAGNNNKDEKNADTDDKKE